MRRLSGYLIYLILIPLLIILGFLLYEDRQYHIISLIIVILALLPFFFHFEKRIPSAAELVLIAVLTALVVASRILFSPFPFVKPVIALLILIAMVLGKEMGFVVGALSALLSNFYFMQGAWTPYQMFAWGLIAYFAGLFHKFFRRFWWGLLLYGLFAGVLLSFIMDIQSVLFFYKNLSWKGLFLAISYSVPVTIIYAVSNVIFLLLFKKPVLKILDRIKIKYGLYQ